LSFVVKPLEKLRIIRHEPEHAAFDGRFYEKHPDFWPIAHAAEHFRDHPDWPDPSTYASAFDAFDLPVPPVRFEVAPIKRKRPPGPIDRSELYDAKIVKQNIVSTRARMWHDYLNALVWATFPRAKMALHRRQHLAIEKWLPLGATQLPNARTRELDALALIDEGGVLMLEDHARNTFTRIVFGHALFEGLVLQQPAMICRGLRFDVDDLAAKEPRARTKIADEFLAARLDDIPRIQAPEDLERILPTNQASLQSVLQPG
jgi:hypothetical protein